LTVLLNCCWAVFDLFPSRLEHTMKTKFLIC